MVPFVTMLWTACGIRLIQKQSSQPEVSKTCVFMDDRNVACSSAREVALQKTAWNDWSAKVGLVENQSKAAVATVSSQHRNLAEREGLSEWLQPTVRLLGCFTAAAVRGYTEHESQRIESAKTTVRLLASVRLPFELFHRAVATFAAPMMCYGWVARCINDKDLWRFWSQVRHGDRVCRLANRFTRALVLGGCCHPEIVSAKHLLRAVAGCSERSLERWFGARGHPVRVLRDLLARLGFETPHPWHFQHHAGPQLDLRRTTHDMDKLAHELRQAWRASLWERYLDRNRHECRDFRRPRNRIQWKELLDIDFDSVRKWAFSSPEARCIALGSYVSPAWCLEGVPTRCIWQGCDCEVASWHHVAWSCRHRPSKLRKPSSPFMARWGWHQRGANTKESVAVRSWLAAVVEQTWVVRHPRI